MDLTFACKKANHSIPCRASQPGNFAVESLLTALKNNKIWIKCKTESLAIHTEADMELEEPLDPRDILCS